MKFKEAESILKSAGIKFKTVKDWSITIPRKDCTKDMVQKFLKTCRIIELCQWHIVFPDDSGKDPVKIWWTK